MQTTEAIPKDEARAPSCKEGLPSQELGDPVASAKAAGLRYVLDTLPGIRRRRAGSGFYYLAPDSTVIREDTLRRIKALAIPPAWTDVWICPDPRGHLQATGRDAKGRKQYRYHPHWQQVRDAVKYGRMVAFGEALPRIRERIDRDLAQPGIPREKVLATVVWLLENTLIRIGNDEYRRENSSFGLTTLRDGHVEVQGPTLKFEFRGKGGKCYSVKITSPRLARVVKRCQEIPGHELFQYLDEKGERHAVESGDVNDYLREIGGGDFTAKDFRTWAGTVLAARCLRDCEPCTSERQCKQEIARAIEQVAQRLGNTPAVCRRCYIHPAVIDAYRQGYLGPIQGAGEDQARASPYALSREEQSVLDLLRSSC